MQSRFVQNSQTENPKLEIEMKALRFRIKLSKYITAKENCCAQLMGFFSNANAQRAEEKRIEILEEINNLCKTDPITAGKIFTQFLVATNTYCILNINDKAYSAVIHAFIDAGADLNQVVAVPWIHQVYKWTGSGVFSYDPVEIGMALLIGTGGMGVRQHEVQRPRLEQTYELQFQATPLSAIIFSPVSFKPSIVNKMLMHGADYSKSITQLPTTKGAYLSYNNTPFAWTPMLLAALENKDVLHTLSTRSLASNEKSIPEQIEQTKHDLGILETLYRTEPTSIISSPFSSYTYSSQHIKEAYFSVIEEQRAVKSIRNAR